MTENFERFKSPLSKAHWPWPKMDIQEVSSRAEDWEIYMPNIGYMKVDSDNNWDANLGDAANSKRLWLNSLVSAHACLEVALTADDNSIKINKAEVAGRIIKSYIDKNRNESTTFQGAWQDEHAVANRLFVIVGFLHASCCGLHSSIETTLSKYVSIVELLFEANKHAKWLNEDAHYIENNHGTMMDLALAQFGVFLKVIDPATSALYLATALRRLEKMLDSTFDKDGCCTENSPTYHFVNYALFSTIEQFIQRYHLGNTEKWGEKLTKARRVGHLLLRPDGTIPLVGDSECRPGTFFPMNGNETGEQGVGYFPNAGFFVASLPDFHLTFRAGGSKFTHRHIDDLSLTLWVRGKEFIVDSGLFNYDINDRMRRWFISTRSHSGIYLESSGDVRFATFESPLTMSKFTGLQNGKNVFNVTGDHNLSAEACVQRTVDYKNSVLTIQDSFSTATEQKWRAQFMLHPDVIADPLSDGKGFRLTNQDQIITIRVISNDYNLKIENSHYSPNFMKNIPSKAVIIYGKTSILNLSVEILI